MKKIKILFLALVLPAMTLVSCDKKDNNLPEPQPQPPVVTVEKYEGTWEGIEMSVEAFFMSQSLYSYSADLEEGEFVIKINSNNTVEIIGSETIMPSGIYTYSRVNDYSIKFEADIEEEEDFPLSGPIEYTFEVDSEDVNKSYMYAEKEDIVIEEGLPPLDIKMNMTLSK